MDGISSTFLDSIDLGLPARRAAAHMLKMRARRFARRPAALDALCPGLSAAAPDRLVAIARHLVAREGRSPRRWFGFGGEVTLINARAALLLGRALRRAARTGEHGTKNPTSGALSVSPEPNLERLVLRPHPLSVGVRLMTSGLTLQDDTAQPLQASLSSRLFATRRHSLDLAAPLSPEDQVVQASDDASPTKWHLAHVTWFFETFLLKPFLPSYRLFDERFPFCFNSYYEAEGARHPRGLRGLLTRPTHDEVLAYRAHVDRGLRDLFASGAVASPDVAGLIEVGIHHEQQHQELLMTDILALFAAQPLRPAYSPAHPALGGAVTPLTFTSHEGGIVDIGHTGDAFSFDNEGPRHKALLQPFTLADRLVTNGEWLAFMEDGGYRAPGLWLADGWGTVKTQDWSTPLYWERRDSRWFQMGLHGLQPLDLAAPVTHISFFEADAYARWAGKRLPTEFEWEQAALIVGETKRGDGPRHLHPIAATPGDRQMFGQVWQWTQSAYLPYPGYRAAPGAIGEYNGKFMVSQQVLRGSSCVTPPGHDRLTYRNFFYPHQRWQFTGLRLASDR